ncbi:MAG: hypothetical protein ACREOG_16250 [Gemmatimonadaceae bacterium]
MFSLRRWRPRHLLLAWTTYWLGLGLVALGPAVPAVMRATRASDGGSISASMGDGGIVVSVVHQGATLWSGTASLTALVLWIAGPPVALWLAWLMRRPAIARPAAPRSADQEELASAADGAAALPEPSPNLAVRSRPHDVERRS